jgi:hypothetical protein
MIYLFHFRLERIFTIFMSMTRATPLFGNLIQADVTTTQNEKISVSNFKVILRSFIYGV